MILLTIGVVIVALAPVASATDGEANYRDRFAAVSYSGSDGTLTWGSTWQEIGDDDDDPSAGPVRVVGDSFCAGGRCLRAAGLPPGTGGLRHAQHGIQAGYDQGMFGDADMIRPEVLGLTADHRMAVEVVSSSWVGLVGLVLVITAALVTGLDRRKPQGITGG